MPSGIADRLRKNDAFVQQTRNSSDINYYNVDSMVTDLDRACIPKPVAKTLWIMKDSTNFRISLIHLRAFFSFKTCLPLERMRIQLLNPYLSEIRYREIKLPIFRCEGKLAPSVDDGNPNSPDLRPSRIIEFLPRVYVTVMVGNTGTLHLSN